MQARVDTEVNALVDHFAALVRAARVSDPIPNAQETVQIGVHAARTAQAGEALLDVLAELKRSNLLSNAPRINANVDASIARFEGLTAVTEQALQRISNEVEMALADLEQHYYSSAQAAPDVRLELCHLMQRLEAAAVRTAPINPPVNQ